MDENTKEDEEKRREIGAIINGSGIEIPGQPKQPIFIKDTDVPKYLAESIEKADDEKKKEEIENFCKKHPKKSPAILAYLATSYLVFVELTNFKHIDPEATKPENGFNYFTQKLLENYKQEKTPNPQTSGASAESQSSGSQQL